MHIEELEMNPVKYLLKQGTYMIRASESNETHYIRFFLFQICILLQQNTY